MTGFVCDINRPSKELPVQSKLLKHKNKMWKLSRIKNEEDGVVPVSLLLTVNAFQTCLKSGCHLPKKTSVICLIETPLQIIKNALYFILKALFVLKIFKFLSRLFDHVGKNGLIRKVWFTSNCNTHIAQYLTK